MYLELRHSLVVVDLRTKESVLNYIKKYNVDIPQLDDDDCYFHGNMNDFKRETGMSDEEVVDMLFEIEDEDEMYIVYTYLTDSGRARIFELRLGEISYFEYDYPYVDKISEDVFYSRIKSMKEFLAKLDEMNRGGNKNASK